MQLQQLINHIFGSSVNRKQFLQNTILLGSAFIAGRSRLFGGERTLQPRTGKRVKTAVDLASVTGDDPAAATRKAIELLGGIGKFVSRGDVVVVKPNIGWNRAPEYAANTNPAVVETIVRLCYGAGAKTVKVFDNTCNDARMCYENSGIAAAAKRGGAEVFHMPDWKYYPARMGKDMLLDGWPIFRDAVECDCFINVPIAKHHSLAGLTLSMKNLMGVCGGMRGRIHWKIDRKVAELTAFIKPDLTIIDAYRVLLKHGPSGGDLDDVALKKTVIAGTDPVLADAFAAKLLGRDPSSLEFIGEAVSMRLGSMDTAKARVARVAL